MQSTGHTSMHASQPVQLSAFTTANSGGSFFRALPAPFAIFELRTLRPILGPRRTGPARRAGPTCRRYFRSTRLRSHGFGGVEEAPQDRRNQIDAAEDDEVDRPAGAEPVRFAEGRLAFGLELVQD